LSYCETYDDVVEFDEENAWPRESVALASRGAGGHLAVGRYFIGEAGGGT